MAIICNVCMYVCIIYVYVYVCNNMYVNMQCMYVMSPICMYVYCMYVCMYVCM
jgi:hypothetical protein